jgi:hypothetical protein
MSHFNHRKAVKKFFIGLISGVLCLIISGCSMPFLGPQDEYYKFYNQVYNDRKSLIKGKTLSEADPSFWNQTDAIPVTLYKSKLIARGVGKINAFETGKGGVVAAAPSFIILGINPLTAAGSALAFLLIGPQREAEDPAFQEQIDKFLASYNWQSEEYFFQVLKKGTALPLNRESTDDFMLDRFGKPMSETAELGKRNVKVSFMFMIMPNKMGGWTEPKYNLISSIGLTIASDEALRAFNTKFPMARDFSMPPIFSLTQWGEGKSGTELRKVEAFPGMYMGTIYRNSAYFSKEQWLSNNGAFLEEQLKLAITYLAQEADHLLFAGNQ